MSARRSILYVLGAVGVAFAATYAVDLVRPLRPARVPAPVAAPMVASATPATLVSWDDLDLSDEVIVVPAGRYTARHLIRPQRADQMKVDPERGGGICGLPEDGVLIRMRRTDGPGPVLTRLPAVGVQPIDGPSEATWMLFYLESDSPGGWHCRSDLLLVRTEDVQRMLAAAGQAS